MSDEQGAVRECPKCADEMSLSTDGAYKGMWCCMSCATPATTEEQLRSSNREIRRLRAEARAAASKRGAVIGDRIVHRQIGADGDRMLAWHDGPIIGLLYVIKHVAKKRGYAVGWHGSLARDLDLVAVPWIETASTPEQLVRSIMDAIGGEYTPGQSNPSVRPHGRLSYAINLMPTGMYVDLSVMPPVGGGFVAGPLATDVPREDVRFEPPTNEDADDE